MPGMLGGRCGSPAISGEPVALRAPLTGPVVGPAGLGGEADRTPHGVDLLDQGKAVPGPRLLGDEGVVGRIGRVELPGQLRAQRPRHVPPQQLPLPVGREAEGEQLAEAEDVEWSPRLEAQAQQLHLEGRRRARGGGVDPGAEALQQLTQARLERLLLAPGDATDAEGYASGGRPAAPRGRPSRRSGPRPRGGRSPSARADPGRGSNPGRSRGRDGSRPRCAGRPSGPAAPAPGPRARPPRRSRASSAAAAAPASARPQPSRRRRVPTPPLRPAVPPVPLDLPSTASHLFVYQVWPGSQEIGSATASRHRAKRSSTAPSRVQPGFSGGVG